VTPLASLSGCRIRRIDAPDPELLALSLIGRELRSVLLFCFSAERTGVGLLSERPHGLPASSLVQKLRKEIDGARIAAFEQLDDATLGLRVQRADSETVLRCDFRARSVCVWQKDRAVFTWNVPGGRSGKSPSVRWPDSVEELQAQGPLLLAQQAAASVDDERTRLSQLLKSAQKRLQRRLGALDEDMARAEGLRTRATLLLSNKHAVQRGQTAISLIDYSVDPPCPLEIGLDPARTLAEQIEAWFKQAKRFERGAQLAAARKQATQQEIEAIDGLRQQLTAADESELVVEIAERARALGIAGVTRVFRQRPGAPRSASVTPQRKPYREFRGFQDRVILVGKRAEDNDALTREHARPQDLWLHARGHAGAHVVVAMQRDEACPEELLVDAAHLAAHFSAARDEPIVEISYTSKRYVRKPRGAAPGKVTLEREKVIAVHLEPARLKRLLSNERFD
jgi:predicted ribosome quality control (RQC) complex YloA/Tae2 family protein